MKKLLILLVILLVLPLISSASTSFDQEIQKLTHYAEDYEIGNINYVQLLLYMSNVKQNLNEVLGATEKQEGGVLKQEQIEAALGKPNKETKWVWVEREEREKKLDNSVPVWENKIVFDGKKIRVTLNAYPSIFHKLTPEIKKQITELKEEGKFEDATKLSEEGGNNEVVYRLNFRTDFKKPEEQLDIQGKINSIKSLAEIFNSDPSRENGVALAKESVNAERLFENYFKQSGGKCEDIMKSIFGAENFRESMGIITQEISFYEKDRFEVIARLEICDDCQWHWTNLNLWIERRGPGIKMPEGELEMKSPDSYKDIDEVVKVVDDLEISKKVARLVPVAVMKG